MFNGRGKTHMRLDQEQMEMVDDAMAEVLRRKTPAERIKIGFEIWSSAYKMLLSHLKTSHPEWTPEMVSQEAARRISLGSV
jgi:hypothetical protein